jgi:hypothetical protein
MNFTLFLCAILIATCHVIIKITNICLLSYEEPKGRNGEYTLFEENCLFLVACNDYSHTE